MQKLTMCRICLVENVSMCEVSNNDLQEMYEKLTDIPFVTENCRPMLACFFCYAKLKQCCKLLRKCLKAEEVFAQMLNGDYEQIPSEFEGEIEFYGGFIKTSIDYMSIGADTEQLPVVCDIKQEIEIKEEYLSFEVESLEDSYLNQEDTRSHHCELDLEDDVPLMNFKTEVENVKEVPKKNTRASVAKKPKLDIRKAKLEDTITDKQKKDGPSDPKIVHTIRNEKFKSVSKFREPIFNDTISKSKVNNSTLYNEEEVIEDSPNKEHVKEVIKTAIDTNCRVNGNQNDLGYQLCNEKVKKHKKICKPYACDVCQYSFALKSNLDKHIRTHTGEKPYKCDVCQRSFSRKDSLTSHHLTHTGEKPYKCDVCQRNFTSKSYLARHIRIHTGEKPYKCDVCQRSSRSKGDLARHIRTHTGEKPYKCDVCQRSFTLIFNLKSHRRIHIGENPHKCDVCQRSFARKASLKLHHLTHTGERPYKCNECQRSFTVKSKLKSHHRTCVYDNVA